MRCRALGSPSSLVLLAWLCATAAMSEVDSTTPSDRHLASDGDDADDTHCALLQVSLKQELQASSVPVKATKVMLQNPKSDDSQDIAVIGNAIKDIRPRTSMSQATENKWFDTEACIVDLMPLDFYVAGSYMLLGIAAWVFIFVFLSRAQHMEGQPTANRTNTTEEQAMAGSQPSVAKVGGRLDSVEGARVLLTVYILCFHAKLMFGKAGWTAILNDSIAHGTMQLFFVLSGYVCFLSEAGKRSAFTFSSGISYFLKRLTRLAPLFWVADICQFAVHHVSGRSMWTIQATFADVLYPWVFCGYDPGSRTMYAANVGGWFVSCLVWLGLAFPWLYNKCPDSTQAICLVWVVMVGLCSFLSDSFYFPFHYTWLPRRIPEFMAGMLTAKLAMRMPEWNKWFGWGLVFDGTLVLGVATLCWSGDRHAAGVFCLTCLAAHLSTDNPEKTFHQGFLGSFFAASPWQTLSTYSYAAYILQCLFRTLMIKLVWGLEGQEAGTYWWQGYVHVPLAYLFGVVGHKMIQEPSQKLLSRFLAQSASKK